MTTTNPRRANGHQRNKIIAQVKREEDDCWLCEQPVDKTLTMQWGSHGQKCQGNDCPGCTPHPLRAEIDEVIPVSLGGDPLDRKNCRLSHRRCNRRRSNGTWSPESPVPEIKRARQW